MNDPHYQPRPPHDPSPLPALPESLQQELRGLYSPPLPGAMASRDAAILAAARRAGASRRSWRLAVGSGLAAAVALAASLYWSIPAPPAPTAAASAYARTGDIRDAYYLARQLKQASDGNGTPALDSRGYWDANRDGRIDRTDVDALALAVVQLGSTRLPGVP